MSKDDFARDLLILVSEKGEFTCSECGHKSVVQVSSVNGGIEDVNVEDVKSQLIEFPTKIIYGICPVCGMEYIFRYDSDEDELYLEMSDEEK